MFCISADMGEKPFNRIYMCYRSPFQRLKSINICSESFLHRLLLLPESSEGKPRRSTCLLQPSAAEQGNHSSWMTFVESRSVLVVQKQQWAPHPYTTIVTKA